MSVKPRNETVDLVRGIAMAMVVLGHTMTGCTVDSQSTLLFNVIWSLQMPLFFCISGYVTRYGKVPENGQELASLVLKRTRAYLLPWMVWTFLIRGLLFGQKDLLDLKFLLWHMDSGYWFLFSLWMISILALMAQYLSNYIRAKLLYRLAAWGFVYVLGACGLLVVGMAAGFSFLGIKLTLYYMLYFGAGFFGGVLQNERINKEIPQGICNVGLCACAIVYSTILLKYNLYTISDSLIGIFLRVVASFSGCMCLCWLCARVKRITVGLRLVQWVGRNSLGIYLVHYLLLSIIKKPSLPALGSLEGVWLVLVNFVLTMTLSAFVAYLLDGNNITRSLCLGKKRIERHS